MFAIISLPFIAALSHSKGRLTYGDVGPIAYRHIMGEDLERPSRLEAAAGIVPNLGLAAAPHIRDYSAIIKLGPYPPWADPSYLYDGTPPKFILRRQLNRIHVVWRYYFDVYAIALGSLLCGILVLLFASGNPVRFASLFLRQAALWFPALFGLFVYGLARVEGRFLAGFTIALFAAAIAAIRFDHEDQGKTVAKSVAFAVTLLLSAQVILKIGQDAERFAAPDFPDWQIAKALESAGINPRDRVSYMGDGLTDHAWAYFANVSIVAEIPEEDVATFWAANPGQKHQVLSWLSSAGAKVLVTKNVPGSALSPAWQPVPRTAYYILKLPEAAGPG
jgi:hypothetical protein